MPNDTHRDLKGIKNGSVRFTPLTKPLNMMTLNKEQQFLFDSFTHVHVL